LIRLHSVFEPSDNNFAWVVSRHAVAAYLSRVSPSRDGTVAVEDVEKALLTLDEAWRDYWHSAVAGYASTGRLRDRLHETRDRLLAEFGSGGAGESNEGGNQNDERRH
jgi:hypothetical protein